jgi:hypothetical protein
MADQHTFVSAVARKNQVCTHTDVPSRHALDLGETAIHK